MNEAALLERKFGRNTVPLLTEGAMGAVTQKWAPMLQGIQNPWRRRIVGMMLENQATYFNETMTEEVRTNVVGNFLKVVFPMIRRAYAEIVAPELVSVQPPINLRDHLSNIIVPISQVSNLIHKRTLRGPANWIVTSTAVAALLEITPYFTSNGEWKGQMGIYKAGTLQGKWTVYVDPYFQDNLILVGRQGTSMLDTGYVWAPYIALQVTGTFQDPGDQTMRKGLRTRYAKLMVRPEFYGAVLVDNLK